MSIPAWSSGSRNANADNHIPAADNGSGDNHVATSNGPYAPLAPTYGIGSGGPLGAANRFTEQQLVDALAAGETCATIAALSGVGAATIPAVVAICGALQLSGVPIQQKAQQLYNAIRSYL